LTTTRDPPCSVPTCMLQARLFSMDVLCENLPGSSPPSVFLSLRNCVFGIVRKPPCRSGWPDRLVPRSPRHRSRRPSHQTSPEQLFPHRPATYTDVTSTTLFLILVITSFFFSGFSPVTACLLYPSPLFFPWRRSPDDLPVDPPVVIVKRGAPFRISRPPAAFQQSPGFSTLKRFA